MLLFAKVIEPNDGFLVNTSAFYFSLKNSFTSRILDSYLKTFFIITNLSSNYSSASQMAIMCGQRISEKKKMSVKLLYLAPGCYINSFYTSL